MIHNTIDAFVMWCHSSRKFRLQSGRYFLSGKGLQKGLLMEGRIKGITARPCHAGPVLATPPNARGRLHCGPSDPHSTPSMWAANRPDALRDGGPGLPRLGRPLPPAGRSARHARDAPQAWAGRGSWPSTRRSSRRQLKRHGFKSDVHGRRRRRCPSRSSSRSRPRPGRPRPSSRFSARSSRSSCPSLLPAVRLPSGFVSSVIPQLR